MGVRAGRQVVATGYGGPEHLEVRRVEVPDPGPGEVTIEVRAAAVNPFDVKRYAGLLGTDASALPMALGAEVAGVVVAVGGDGDRMDGAFAPVSLGDDVVAYPVSGGYADAVTVPASSVFERPAEVSWAQAAGMSLAGVTAVHLLEATGVGAGSTVLVHGAGGSVGLAAAQLAIGRGATVVGTAAEHRHAALRAYGIVPVVYGAGLADRVRAAAPDGVDVALDTVGTDEAVDVSLEVVGDPRRVASVAAFGRGDTGISLLGSGPGADPGTDLRSAARRTVAAAAGRGELDVVVAETFPLEDVAAAHRLVAAGHAGGKVVLIP